MIYDSPPRKPYHDNEDDESDLPLTGIRRCLSHRSKAVTENSLYKKRLKNRQTPKHPSP